MIDVLGAIYFLGMVPVGWVMSGDEDVNVVAVLAWPVGAVAVCALMARDLCFTQSASVFPVARAVKWRHGYDPACPVCGQTDRCDAGLHE